VLCGGGLFGKCVLVKVHPVARGQRRPICALSHTQQGGLNVSAVDHGFDGRWGHGLGPDI
jgi:hypothetical protein